MRYILKNSFVSALLLVCSFFLFSILTKLYEVIPYQFILVALLLLTAFGFVTLINRTALRKYNYHAIVFFFFPALFLFLVEINYLQKQETPGNLEGIILGKMDEVTLENNFITDSNGIFVANKQLWDSIPGAGINAYGFRSRPFIRPSERDTSKTTVFFVGDSFTWGQSADPVDSSFVDLVDKDTNLLCYNFGIPAVGPIQYWQIVKTYVPIFKPDAVAVMFYGGNDILLCDREIIPGQQYYYASSKGIISGYKLFCNEDSIAEPLTSFDEAYRHYVKYRTIWGDDENWITKVCSWSVFGTRLWKKVNGDKMAFLWPAPKIDITNRYISQIENFCAQHQVKCFIFYIPADHTFSGKVEDGLLPHGFLAPPPGYLKEHDYVDGANDHLNNSGHFKYAKFISKTLNDSLDIPKQHP